MTDPTTLPAARRHALARLLAAVHDVLRARPDDDEHAAIAVLRGRGWADALLALGDDEVDAIEGGAPLPASMPATLRTFVRDVQQACALPLLSSSSGGDAPRRHVRPRKNRQIEAVASLVAPWLTREARIVDVGSGHGHLTRALSSSFGVAGLGLERDEALRSRAAQLAHEDDVPLDFVTRDVLREGLALRAGDCVVGLHACGELGDVVATTLAADATPRVSVCFLGCCLQKQRGDVRRSLLDDDDALAWPRALLGLSNVSTRNDGVEASRADNLAARRRRLAVRALLLHAGVVVAPGRELAGLNRRAAHDALPRLVQRVFAARGLPSPTTARIAQADDDARTLHARLRRLALPRVLLARAIEVYVLCERALVLERGGFEVQIGLAFADDVSARNLVVLAQRR